MKNLFVRKSLSRILCLVLIAAIALFSMGCGDSGKTGEVSSAPQSAEVTELGSGSTSFDFAVTYADKSVDRFKVFTDSEMVGDALKEVKLIDGEIGDYGLMVTTVNNVTVKYEDDGKYWAFYINGEYAMSGVDKTPIADENLYEFVVE